MPRIDWNRTISSLVPSFMFGILYLEGMLGFGWNVSIPSVALLASSLWLAHPYVQSAVRLQEARVRSDEGKDTRDG